MSKHRYVGGIISATLPTPSQSSASGVWTLDEAEYYQKSGNWPPGSGADPYFNYTTLLLHGDGTNGAQNNTFLDSSTNNFTITRNGNTTQGSFDPYVGPGCWSDFYASTSSGWQTPAGSLTTILGSAFNATSTFTVEAWIYPVSRHTGGGAVLGYVVGAMQLAGGQVDWSFGPDSNGKLTLFWYNSGNYVCNSTNTIPLNTWTHIALSISSGSIKMFINGTQEVLTGTTTTTGTSGTALTYVSSGGYLYAGTTWQGFNGYISNLRIIGKRAVYTTSFTPSTTPLIATTDTTLLVNNQNGFVDMSASNYALTTTGGVQISKFSPFTLYQITPASYSGYFDGNGDYISYPANTGLQLATMDFTMEAWVYPTARVTNSAYIISQSNYGVGSDFVWWITSTGTLQFYLLTGGAGNIVTSTGTIPLGAWTHVAIVRSGSQFRLYINGTQDGSLNNSSSITNTYLPTTIGNSTNNLGTVYFPGSISNLRIIKGVAVYTSNFTPASTPLTTTTAVSSSSSYSTSFDGTGDYLAVSTTANAAFGFGTGDFTVEAWVYYTGTNASATKPIIDFRGAVAVAPSIFGYTSNQVALYYNGSIRYQPASLSLTSNAWNHVALVRSSGVSKFYVNGVGASTTYTDTNNYPSGACIIGTDSVAGGSAYWNGFLSNIRVTKGQALYTADFTPSTSPLTTTSQGATAANVSLLTCQNNLLQDNSTNLFKVTANGDAKPTSMNPFVTTNGIAGTSYSGAFDGSGDYLTLPAPSATTIGTNSFTWEAWLYPTAVGTFSVVYDTNASGDATGTGRFLVTLEATGQIKLTTNAGTTTLLASTPNLLVSNQWVHVAITRSGTAGYMFFNGVQVATGTFSTDFLVATSGATNRPIIGANGYNGSNGFSGYISNLRLIIGSALYTSAFTPPTAPLTAVANTQLLTCQSTTFVDNSGNAITITAAGNAKTNVSNPFSGSTSLLTLQNTTFIDNSAIPQTLTANGNARPKSANPFTDTVTGPTAYSTTVYGGSGYFDGTGDYLSCGTSTNLALGAGNFTVECWINPSSVAIAQNIILDWRSSNNSNLSFYLINAQVNWRIAATNPIAAGSVVANAWTHLAVVRNSGTTTLYINGATTASFSDANTYGIDDLKIGKAWDANYWNGYLSNIRIVKGTAVYTGPFVPPAAPMAAVFGTQLLLNMTNGGIFDNTTTNDLETVGNAQISTSVVKYGTGSIAFSGTTSQLTFPYQPAIDEGTGPFTWEMWIYPTALPATAAKLIDGNGANEGFFQLNSAGTLSIGRRAIATDLTTSSTVSTNQWTHVAVTRDTSNIVRIFINGVAGATSGTNTNNYGPNNSWRILGNDATNTFYFTGYMDDVRITRGYARYTANFTPPAAPFPNY